LAVNNQFLLSDPSIEIVAAVRTTEKSGPIHGKKGIATVLLDYDDESTHIPCFQNIDRVFMLTAYTVDMLRQSKALLITPKSRSKTHRTSWRLRSG
jgi:hypothetical protein